MNDETQSGHAGIEPTKSADTDGPAPTIKPGEEIRERLLALSENAIHREGPDRMAATNLKLQRLTSAVLVLCAMIFLHMVASLWMHFSSQNGASPFLLAGTAGPPATLSGSSVLAPPGIRAMEKDLERFNGFHDWPVEKQIETASVIAIAKFEKVGDSHRAVISEILKKTPGTQFYYKVGDEYERGPTFERKGVSYGDGQIMFFTGSPAQFRCSSTFFGDRIMSLGDMPIEEIRRKVR